jgi:putative transposase
LHKRLSRTKDHYKKDHPNYRKFQVDPAPPIIKPAEKEPVKDYKTLLLEYHSIFGKELKPVKPRNDSQAVPVSTVCPHCGAPHQYIYYNDGIRRTQLKCKVCGNHFQLQKRYQNSGKTSFYCPYFSLALYRWKDQGNCIIHKCGNDNCSYRLKNLSCLNSKEKALLKTHSSQFKLCYQFREYHLKPDDLKTISPKPSRVSIKKIHHSLNTLCLALSFHVSFALTARKTALIMKQMFQINISYQTILNYSEAVAPFCHNFNLAHKGTIDNTSVGDETYIKIFGKNHYTWFFLSPSRRSISSYNVSDNRGINPAISSMYEAMRTIPKDNPVTFITDGNPSYTAAAVYFNSQNPDCSDVKQLKVIGLQNLDEESEKYRPFKELIERLNRTYKHHVRPAHGFNTMNGAVSLTTLFVTHYNFLRPHSFLNFETPVILPELSNISSIQGKWAKLLKLAFLTSPPFS